MKKYIIYLLLLFSVSVSLAQNFEPTKEEEEKYMPLLQQMGGIEKNGISDRVLHILDSAYAIDSNSVLLKGLLGEFNLRLIYDSLRTDRIPQEISILQSMFRYDIDDETKRQLYNTLGLLYKHSGKYDIAINYFTQLLLISPTIEDQNFGKNNLVNTYNAAGYYKMALDTVHSLFHSGVTDNKCLFAETYYHNNLLDSALLYANQCLGTNGNNYSMLITKAKILKAQGKTEDICPLAQQAMALIEKPNFEEILARRDKTNPFIQLLIRDVEEAKQLKKEYCN